MFDLAQLRSMFEAACIARGVSCGRWDVAMSRSSYTSITYRGFHGAVRIADHDAMSRAHTYAIYVTTSVDAESRIAKALDGFIARVDAEIARRAAEEERLARRSAAVQAEIERLGLAHLTGPARRNLVKKLRKAVEA